MTVTCRLALIVASAALAFASPRGVSAQTPPATLTQPSPPGLPGPAPATPVSPPAPSVPAPQTPASARTALPTLVPGMGDASDVDQVTLPEKPTIVLSGSAKWDEGLRTLRAAFARIDTELAKAGLTPAGRPLSVFTQTSDDGFKFDAMMPVASLPTPAPTLPPDMRLATTPAGKAYRFVHKGPYDDIDSTYETITAYLDAKDIVAKDAFVEEYVDDIADPADPSLAINIFVQPK